MAELLDGKALNAVVLESLRGRVAAEGLRPHLCVITVGEDPASQVFVKQKRLAAEKIGGEFTQSRLPSEATLEELRGAIREANRDPSVHGIVVQLPLPGALREHEREVLDLVSPSKDVDCFHPQNFGRLALGEPTFLPATPAGIVRMIQHYGIETRGKLCVIVGKSNIVGKPLGLMMAKEDGPAATVVFCDQYTQGMWELTRQADILVVAAGKHHLLSNPAAVRADGQAVIIDVGIHRVQTEEGKTVIQGDVDAAALRPHCRWLTPVPGGVGPMTVACLLEQVVEAASRLQRPSEAAIRAVRACASQAAARFTPEQMKHLLAKLYSGFSQAELDALLGSLVVDSDGLVSFDDFVSWAFGVESQAAPA